MQTTIEKPKQPQQEKLSFTPAALTHAPPPPVITTETKPAAQIPTQPVPPITPRPQPKPATPQEQKPIPKEIRILLNGMEEIEGILYAMRQQISQQYGPVDYSHIEDIELCFPEEQAHKLSFELKGEYWIIRPRAFLGAELFAKIAKNVKEIGGEYISVGKDSHFRVKRN